MDGHGLMVMIRLPLPDTDNVTPYMMQLYIHVSYSIEVVSVSILDLAISHNSITKTTSCNTGDIINTRLPITVAYYQSIVIVRIRTIRLFRWDSNQLARYY